MYATERPSGENWAPVVLKGETRNGAHRAAGRERVEARCVPLRPLDEQERPVGSRGGGELVRVPLEEPRRGPPAGGTERISQSPLRFDAKNTREPSGDQTG